MIVAAGLFAAAFLFILFNHPAHDIEGARALLRISALASILCAFLALDFTP